MTHDLIYFGFYTVACLMLGVFVGAWLTYRREAKKSPVAFDAARMFTALTGKPAPKLDDPYELDGKPKDEAKRWGGSPRPVESTK